MEARVVAKDSANVILERSPIDVTDSTITSFCRIQMRYSHVDLEVYRTVIRYHRVCSCHMLDDVIGFTGYHDIKSVTVTVSRTKHVLAKPC